MTIKFGISPISWSNDDMQELGAETSLESCLRDIMELGFDGTELGHKFPRTADDLRQVLTPFQLELVSGWFSANLLMHDADTGIEALQGHLALLKGMGCDVMVYAEVSNAIHSDKSVPLSKSPVLDNGAWVEFGSRLSKVADYLDRQGIKMAYHHHMGTVVETADEIERFFQVTNENVGIVLDTGHAVMGGVDPVHIIRAHSSRIVHVHCKDIRAAVIDRVVQDDMSFLNGVLEGMFTVPGDGDIDFATIMAELAAVNYQDWIIIEAEQDPAKANPREYAKIGLKTLKNFYAAHYPIKKPSDRQEYRKINV